MPVFVKILNSFVISILKLVRKRQKKLQILVIKLILRRVYFIIKNQNFPKKCDEKQCLLDQV